MQSHRKNTGSPGYWHSAAKEFTNLRSLAAAGLLIAAGIVLKQFNINTPVLKIGFSVLPLALSGYLFGPFMCAAAAVVLDLVGFMMYPGGGLIPGLVLASFIGGFLWGVWLYHRPVRLWRTFAAAASYTLVVSFLLTPLFLSQVLHQPITYLMWIRVPKNAIMLPLNTALIYALQQAVLRAKIMPNLAS